MDVRVRRVDERVKDVAPSDGPAALAEQLAEGTAPDA